jgi:hypothetical protein
MAHVAQAALGIAGTYTMRSKEFGTQREGPQFGSLSLAVRF